MLSRKELLNNPELLRDKARGALIGLAIGVLVTRPVRLIIRWRMD